jgi:hypothetical protein
MEWTQAWSVIGALTGVIALQSFWLNRVLAMFKEGVDRRFQQVDHRFERVESRLDRIESRLDRIELGVVREHGERIARLEERRG